LAREEGEGFDKLSPNGFLGTEAGVNPPRVIPMVVMLLLVAFLIYYLN
jgi:hypothetical protein